MRSVKCRVIFRMISPNWITLLYFEIVYKTIGLAIVFPVIEYLIGVMIRFAGISWLGQENIGEVLKNPLAILMGIGILILAALYIACEITAFLILCEEGWHHKKISLIKLGKKTLVQTVRLLRPGKIGVFSMLILLMFSVASPLSGYLNTFRIPDFLLEFIRGNAALYTGYIGILLLFHLLLFLYIFGLPSMLFSGMTFVQSWRESLRLLLGRKWNIARRVFVLTGTFILFCLLVTVSIVLGLGGYTKIKFEEEAGRQIFQIYLLNGMKILSLVGSTLTAAFLSGVIVYFYHACNGEIWQQPALRKQGTRTMLIQAGSAVLLLAVLLYFVETEMGGETFPLMEKVPMIIAHRAGAAEAPENTLAALSIAIGDKADAVEIDVQQLEDGKLILMHDTNFKRTVGVNRQVWETDYQSVQGMNAGAYFYRDGSSEPVPTLEEFLIRAKGKMRLMIEIKSTRYEHEIEQKVLELIQKYDMADECIIASMDLSILKKVKELDSRIETVYISTILFAEQYDSSFVDGFSIETTSLSRAMVSNAHVQGKKIYGWTANSDFTIKKVLSCGADGIITDNTPYTAYFLKGYGKNLLVENIVGIFYGDSGK